MVFKLARNERCTNLFIFSTLCIIGTIVWPELPKKKSHQNAAPLRPLAWVSERFFPGAHQGIFPKFCRGGQKWWNLFFPPETMKTTFFAEIFKTWGGARPLLPPFRRPWPLVGLTFARNKNRSGHLNTTSTKALMGLQLFKKWTLHQPFYFINLLLVCAWNLATLKRLVGY